VAFRQTAATSARRLRAVVIGVSTYRDPGFIDLPAAAADASAVAAALSDPEGIATPATNVVTLLNAEASRERILAALRWLVTSSASDDTLVIYFAGHGDRGAQESYVCAADTRSGDEATTGVSGADLDAILSENSARGVLVILDCCRSAGFAEHAPAFFRAGAGNEFRLLLSASRAEEPSWEFPGYGTVFSKNLVALLRGDLTAGSIPGAIYLNDLTTFLQRHVADDLTALGSPGVQTPMLAGIHPQDPLLFVHRGLTLERITLRTARYSRQDLRRIFSRAGVALLVGGVVIAALLYAYVDHLEFAQVADAQTLVFSRGHPSLHIFGLPQVVWEMRLPQGVLAPGSPLARNGVVVAALGEPVWPSVETSLRPEARALTAYWRGDVTAARRAVLEVVDGPRINVPEGHQRVARLFATVATAADEGALAELTVGSLQKGVAVEAERGVLRFESEEPTSEMFRFESDPAAFSMLVRDLAAPCTTDDTTSLLFSTRLKARGARPAAFHSILRRRCAVADPETIASLLRTATTMADTRDIVNLAALVGASSAVRRAAEDLDAASPDAQTLRMLALAWEPSPHCDPALWRFHTSADANVRWAMATALLAGCPGRTFAFRDLRLSAYYLADLGIAGRYTPDEVARGLSQATTPHESGALLRALRTLRDPTTYDVVLSFYKRMTDPQIKADAVKTLAVLSNDPNAPASLMRSGHPDVQQEALVWMRRVNPRSAFREVLDRLATADARNLVATVGAWRLTPAELADLRRHVASDRDRTARRRGAAILAMHGSVDDVVGLLTRPEWELREAASSYAAFNEGITKKDLTGLAPLYPDAGGVTLRDELALRETLATDLRATPPQYRTWRADLTLRAYWDATPGLRLWLSTEAQDYDPVAVRKRR
jgi:hypothetical protein